MSKSVLKKILCTALLATSLGMTNMSVSHANYPVFDAANHDLLQQILATQSTLAMQQQNLKKLNLGGTIEAKNVIDTITELDKARGNIHALGSDFNAAEKQFDTLYHNYADWNGVPASQYVDQYKRLNDEFETSMKKSLVSQGLVSSEELAKTSNVLAILLAKAQSADGILAVNQALTQIAAMQLAETQKLEAIISDSLRTQNMYLQKQVEKEKINTQQAKEFSGELQFKDVATEILVSKIVGDMEPFD